MSIEDDQNYGGSGYDLYTLARMTGKTMGVMMLISWQQNSFHKVSIEKRLAEIRAKQRIRTGPPSLLRKQVQGEFKYWIGKSRRFKRKIAVQRTTNMLIAKRAGFSLFQEE